LTPPVRITSPPRYWRCEPGWSWHARPLGDHLLWYVLDGVGELTVDGRRCELTAGMCIVFAPGDEPVAWHDPHRRLLIFGMHFQVGPSQADEVLPPARWCRLRDQDLAAGLARRSDIGHRRGDPLGLRQSELCLEQFLCLMSEDIRHPAPGPVDAALDEITRAIRRDPARRWSVAELAGRASLSRSQFNRRFIAHTGLPPARYLIQARVDRARHLLAETTMSVTQVAAVLGYTDIAYFSRQYKRYTGHSPVHSTRAPPRSTPSSPGTW
jgi:AraC family transcriptional regulator of arabinose operon